MPHLLCLIITICVGIVILALLWWLVNKALAVWAASGNPAPPPIAPALVNFIFAFIVVVAVIAWLVSGMPCLFQMRG
jgi:hypothetical protein